jgi:hypothetical protein
MRVFRLTIFLMLVSAFGCAGSQPVRMQLPPGARIGILNVLEPQMTHVNVGSLRYDSFTKGYNVDWNIPDYISRTIENDLKARGTCTFIPIAAVFQPLPAILAAYGWAPCSKSSLPDFPWKSDLQFLGPAVIQQVRPYVEHLGAEAARTALANAGLLL